MLIIWPDSLVLYKSVLFDYEAIDLNSYLGYPTGKS
jgi:hypothetical protein